MDSRVIGVDSYMASALVNLDLATLRQAPPGSLRPGDYPTSQVLSPDHRTIAFGSTNDGTIITLDPATFTRTGVVRVLHKRRNVSEELRLLSWPTSRLIVGLAQGFTVHVLQPGRLLLVDPGSGRVRRQISLHGSAVAEAAASDGTAVILVGDLHDTGPARLVTVDARGRVRSVSLPAVPAGWNSEADQQWPGLLVNGHTAYALGEGHAVTTVALDSLKVETHSVPGLMVERILPLEPAMTPGSGGIFRVIRRSATRVGRHQILVTGGDTFPAKGGTRNQSVSHPAMLVDTRTWRISKVFHGAGRVEVADSGHVYLSWMTSYANGREIDSLAGMSLGGHVLWRIRLGGRYANLFDGHLIISHTSGLRSEELDVRTGRPVRKIGTWDHDYLIVWNRGAGMRVSPALS